MTGRFVRAALACGFAILPAILPSCSDRTPGPPPEQAALGGEVAARVGTEVIPATLVAKVAADQHVAPKEALRRLLDDAICANSARSRGHDREPAVAWSLTAVRGRMTADRISAEARQGGPPTDAEIAELTAKYWREVDRPAGVRVVHAVAERTNPPDANADARAKEIAAEIRAATLAATSADDFLAKAKDVPHEGVKVTVQPLEPFTDEGWLLEGQQRMNKTFTNAAFALTKPGETSPVVESPFGWHVIRLVELVPEQRMPLEARRAAFTEETYMVRARKATDARIAALRARVPIAISPSAEQLTGALLGRPPPDGGSQP